MGPSTPSSTEWEVSNRCRSWEGLLAPLPAREKGPRVAIKGAKEHEEARGGGRGGGTMCGGHGGGVGEREGGGRMSHPILRIKWSAKSYVRPEISHTHKPTNYE